MSGLPTGLPPNPLNASLFTGNGVGPLGLNPTAAQGAQNAALTQQSQNSASNMAQLLQQQGQQQNQKFTSPWQVAGQMAQALKGRMLRNQANQGAAALNAPTAPGQPAGGAAPMVPGQSPATPPAPGGAPAGGAPPNAGWNPPLQAGAAAGAAAPMPPQGNTPPQIPPNMAGMDLSDLFG